MSLTDHAKSYVAFKRATGLSFKEPEQLLANFALHAEARGDRFVRVKTALPWASQAGSPQWKRKRLQLVRGLAVHLHAEDERHEVPHRDAFGRATRHRPPPRLLSLTQIRQVMDAALELPPDGSITPVTFHYIIGLLAATGLRRAEAIGLQLADVTPDGLRIRNAKGGKARLVPLHASVQTALERYTEIRLRYGSPSDHLFVLARGRPISPVHLNHTFLRLTRHLGLRGGPGEPGPRLHDLRHAFAMRALESVESGNRTDCSRHMLALSTYLGHSSAADTYWYLEATPVLLNQVSAATERLHAGRSSDD